MVGTGVGANVVTVDDVETVLVVTVDCVSVVVVDVVVQDPHDAGQSICVVICVQSRSWLAMTTPQMSGSTSPLQCAHRIISLSEVLPPVIHRERDELHPQPGVAAHSSPHRM